MGPRNPITGGTPVVELSGVATTNANGLRLVAANSTIRGLAIGNFSTAISDASAGGTVIELNHLGTNGAGDTVAANVAGIGISGVPGPGITNRATVRNNLISGSSFVGIGVANTSDVIIQGNMIGTDSSGSASIANTYGIQIAHSSNILVGGGLSSEGNLISGNSSGPGIELIGVGTTGNRIQGNLIGTTIDGDAPLGNDTGVNIRNGATGNRIGVESVASERNLISGNLRIGVQFGESNNTNNVVAGNWIGTDITGAMAVANGMFGISISNGPQSNFIGTNGDGVADAIEGNVISGNGEGIRVTSDNSDSNVIAGNYIGTTHDGNAALANGRGIMVIFGPDFTEIKNNVIASSTTGQGIQLWNANGSTITGNRIGIGSGGAALGNQWGGGVRLQGESSDNQIGTDGDGIDDLAEANVVAYNNGYGIAIVDTSKRNSVRGNSIYGNAGLGIDLGDDGITFNDPGDSDLGPNGIQNYPSISYVSDGASTQVIGSFSSLPNATYTLDFYSTASTGSESREGGSWVHSLTVTTDAQGNASFDFILPAPIDSGDFITATATDALGNTSEFSSGQRPETLLTTVTMPFDGFLSFAIYSPDGQLLRSLLETVSVTAGPVAVGWDGRDDFGAILPGGDYQWRAIYSQAQAVDDGQVGELSSQPFGLAEHSHAASAIAVDTAGNVYESSGWEEAHIDLRKWDANGNPVWAKDVVFGGAALAVDDTYVYVSRVIHGETRIERVYASDGEPAPWGAVANGYLVIHNSTDPFNNATNGLAVDNQRLWVSNDESDRVEVYDKVSGSLLGQFSVTDPRGLVADASGHVWAAHGGSLVTLFDVAGVVQREIAGLAQPYALSLGAPSDSSATDNLYVGEVGTGKVREFNLDTALPTQVRELFGGAEPGPIANDRFYWPITRRAGLAVDGNGRITIADNGNKRVLTFNSDGSLLRKRYSEFQPAPFADVNTDPDMLFSTWMQYDVDYTTGEWEVTHNWLPADDKLYSAMGLRRTLSNGQDYVFYLGVQPEAPGEQYVAVVYAIEPTGLRRAAIIGSDTNNLWNWTDSDGDGQVAESEKTYFSDANSQSFQLLAPGSWIDGDGDAWIGHWNEFIPNIGNTSSAVEIQLLGFDVIGNPIYDWSQRQAIVAADTSAWEFDTNNVRVADATGEIFLVGTTERNRDSLFWMGGTAVDRRAADGSRILMMPIGGPPGQQRYVGNGQYIVAIATDTDGEYFYTGHSLSDQHWVRMYTTDGLLVTTGYIGPDNGGHGGWIDHGMGITALKHPSNGTRYVYAEEVYYGKSIRYRIDNLDSLVRDQATFTWTAEAFHVTNTNDSGEGSLRQAIINANANAGHDIITFDIPGTGPHTIQLQTLLPDLVDQVTIDGTSEPDYADVPVIEIVGPGSVTCCTSGLVVRAADSTIRGLSIGNFWNGIQDVSTGGTLIEHNHLGANAAGAGSIPNFAGITASASNAMIRENVISGNSYCGVCIGNLTDVVIQGNKIGTDVSGLEALGNSVGVLLVGQNNLVGGSELGEGNLISGNLGPGIEIVGAGTAGNRVQGNLIGTTVDGDAPLGNDTGINVRGGANANRIGVETDPTERNIVSGNERFGIQFVESDNTNNVVAGNWIGTDITGTIAVGNGMFGIYIANGPQSNFIGTNGDGMADAIEGNVISGNGEGVRVSGDNAANVIAGNYIGTTHSGNAALANDRGIMVLFGPNFTEIRNNVIGSSTAGQGIQLWNANGSVITGNRIGIGVNGSALGNNWGGVRLQGTSSDNQIGTDGDGVNDHAEANIIAHNNADGIAIVNTSERNTVRGNSIYGNAGLGIDLGDDGVTPNDMVDSDGGPNQLQNFPVIISAISGGGSTTLGGTFNSTPNASFTLEFFANGAADPSGFGEGETYLGSAPVLTDATGNANFLVSLPAAVSAGQSVTGTATDTLGNTSEFSGNVPVIVIAAEVAFTSASFTDDEGIGTSLAVSLERTDDSVVSVVEIAITGGTAQGGNVDYDDSAFPLTVTFDVGESTKNVPVPIVQENLVELDEAIDFEVTAISGATIGTQDTSTLTIGNDDSALISINAPAALEGTALEFSVTIDNPVDVAVTGERATQDGTATASDNDFTPLASTNVQFFAAGLTTAFSIPVSTTADGKVEIDETLDLVLSTPVAGGRAVSFGGNGPTLAATGTILNDDFAPVADAGGPYEIDEGDPLTLDASGSSDADGDPITFRWDVDGDATFDSGPSASPTLPLTWNDLIALGVGHGLYSDTVVVEVSDGINMVTDDATLVINNVAPTIESVVGPVSPVDINSQPTALTIEFSDPGTADLHNVSIDWDNDGDFDEELTNITSPLTVENNYGQPGVYEVKVRVTDDDGDFHELVHQFIVVYDPTGGFVTGGGWIDSPPGACTFAGCADDTVGKANFGFVSKYKNGATVPTGQTEFQFKAAGLDFHSASYDWLVIAGKKAMYKGDGTINGDPGFTFQINAIDGDLSGGDGIDKFRIKIKETGGGVIYDNQVACDVDEQGDNDDPCTALGGGNIKIHKANGPASAAAVIAGDANFDGRVDFEDFLILAENFGRNNAVFGQGDFNGDGIVHFSDFLILANLFSTPPTSVTPRDEPVMVDSAFEKDSDETDWWLDWDPDSRLAKPLL